MIFETPRLILRRMAQSDLTDLAQIMQDKDVVYAYKHDFTDYDVQVWLNRQKERYQKYGFGLWAVILKETGEMIGQAGLTMQPCEGSEVLEIGYLFKKKFWHYGYVSETAQGCKEYAFEKLRRNKVYCIIKADNFPSMKVAQRIGMKKEKEFITRYYSGDMLRFLYSVSRV